jgi:hypothetical protein
MSSILATLLTLKKQIAELEKEVKKQSEEEINNLSNIMSKETEAVIMEEEFGTDDFFDHKDIDYHIDFMKNFESEERKRSINTKVKLNSTVYLNILKYLPKTKTVDIYKVTKNKMTKQSIARDIAILPLVEALGDAGPMNDNKSERSIRSIDSIFHHDMTDCHFDNHLTDATKICHKCFGFMCLAFADTERKQRFLHCLEKIADLGNPLIFGSRRVARMMERYIDGVDKDFSVKDMKFKEREPKRLMLNCHRKSIDIAENVICCDCWGFTLGPCQLSDMTANYFTSMKLLGKKRAGSVLNDIIRHLCIGYTVGGERLHIGTEDVAKIYVGKRNIMLAKQKISLFDMVCKNVKDYKAKKRAEQDKLKNN